MQGAKVFFFKYFTSRTRANARSPTRFVHSAEVFRKTAASRRRKNIDRDATSNARVVNGVRREII